MPPEAAHDVSIESMLHLKQRNAVQHLVGSQAFWVTVALVLICIGMSIAERPFASMDNFYNITRNFAFIGLMALGMNCVIITGGIDLSVGSTMGVVAVAAGVTLQAGYPWYAAMVAGLGAGLIVGLINGVL